MLRFLSCDLQGESGVFKQWKRHPGRRVHVVLDRAAGFGHVRRYYDVYAKKWNGSNDVVVKVGEARGGLSSG